MPAGGVPDAWLKDNAARRRIDPSRRTHSDEQLGRFLKPLAAKTPDRSANTFETVDGFRMELVAAEPWCRARSRRPLMRTATSTSPRCATIPISPGPASKPLGTVRLLRDTDGDGRFEQSHVFADGLLWAAGIAPWKGGVFVTAPPDIWYLKDTDGDGKADVRKKVYTGFGTQNQQAMVNNLTWGLDHMDLWGGLGQRRDDPAGESTPWPRGLGRAQRLPLRPGDRCLRAGQRHRPVRQHV